MGNVVEIGVYELQEDVLSKFKGCCSQVFFDRNIIYNISVIDDVTLISKKYDIIFTNIERIMNSNTEKIKRYLEKIKSLIIAVGNTIESLLFAFKINTYRACMKDSSSSEICEILESALDNIYENEKLVIKTREYAKTIAISDIVYIEAIGDGAVIVTEQEQIYATKSLKYFTELLKDKGFYRCHKSYLIALRKVGELHEDYVTVLSKNTKYDIAVSVRKRLGLKNIV